MGIYVRQILIAHVISDIYHLSIYHVRQIKKNLNPQLKLYSLARLQIHETPVAMMTGYILNISRCHDDGIYLTPVAMTTGYIRYIHLWFPLILSVKVVHINA